MRDWYESLSGPWQEVVDQTLHFSLGGGLALLVAWAWPWWASTLFAFSGGVIREIMQNWGDKDNNYLDMFFDLAVIGLGAAVFSLVF